MKPTILGYAFGFNRAKGSWEIRLMEKVARNAGNATFVNGKNDIRTQHVAFGTKDFCQHECERLNKEMGLGTLQ